MTDSFVLLYHTHTFFNRCHKVIISYTFCHFSLSLELRYSVVPHVFPELLQNLLTVKVPVW